MEQFPLVQVICVRSRVSDSFLLMSKPGGIFFFFSLKFDYDIPSDQVWSEHNTLSNKAVRSWGGRAHFSSLQQGNNELKPHRHLRFIMPPPWHCGVTCALNLHELLESSDNSVYYTCVTEGILELFLYGIWVLYNQQFCCKLLNVFKD